MISQNISKVTISLLSASALAEALRPSISNKATCWARRLIVEMINNNCDNNNDVDSNDDNHDHQNNQQRHLFGKTSNNENMDHTWKNSDTG